MSETEVCRSYRNNGKCRFGDDCKFLHTEGEPIQPPLQPRERGECFNFRDSGDCDHGDRCRFTHGAGDARFSGDISEEVCRNFQRGRCKFGDECRRKHEARADDGEEKAGDGEGRRTRQRKPRKPRAEGADGENAGPVDEVCRNFLAGRCKFGDECRRKHEGTPDPEGAERAPRKRRDDRPVKKLDEPCNNFQQGKCRLGDRCRRQHE